MIRILNLFAVLLLLLATSTCTAQITTNWTGGIGDFYDPGQWTAGVPSNADTALFSGLGAVQAFMSNDATIFNFRVDNNSDLVLFGNNELASDFAFVDSGGKLAINENTSLNANVLRVANDSDGILNVTNENTVKVVANAIFANDFGASATINLGEQSSLQVGDLTIASSGNAFVQLEDGSSGFTTSLSVAKFANSEATLNVFGSSWESGEMFVGDNGAADVHFDDNSSLMTDSLVVGQFSSSDGFLWLTNNSNVRVADGMEIASGGGSTGQVRLEGSDLTIESGELVVGNQGDGILRSQFLTSTIQCQDTVVGKSTNSTGEVIMSSAATWNNQGTLIVGKDGIGEVTVFHASNMNVDGLAIIGDENEGSLIAEPLSSADITFNNDLVIGNHSSGLVSINGSSEIDVVGLTISSVESGSTSAIDVEDNAKLMSVGEINIGVNGTASLGVKDNGTVEAGGQMVLAREDGAVAIVTVSDSGSILVGAELVIGDLFSVGQADMTFNGASLSVAGSTLINANSELEILNPAFTTNGIYNAGTLKYSSTSAQFEFDHDLTNDSSGAVIVNSTVGPVIENGNVTNNGDIQVVFGTKYEVLGEYDGLGDMIGGGQVNFYGGVSPGSSSMGTMDFAVDVALRENSSCNLQIGGPVTYDKLNILGSLLINTLAELSISFENGFVPSVGDQFLIGDINQSTTGHFQGLPEGSVAATVGQIDLIISYTAGGGGNDILLTAVETTTTLYGDVNLDGVVDLLDVAPFVDLLTNGGGFLEEADCNMDGDVNLLDVAPFVDILSGM